MILSFTTILFVFHPILSCDMLGLSRWVYLPWTGILVTAIAILGGARQVDAWSLPSWVSSFWATTSIPSAPVPGHRLYNETSCMSVFQSLAKPPVVEADLTEARQLCAALVAAQRTALKGLSDETACERLAHAVHSGFERQDGRWTAFANVQQALLDAIHVQGVEMNDLRRDFNTTAEELRVAKSASSLLDFGVASCFLWTVVLGFFVSMIHRNMLQVTPERTFGLFLVWSMAAFIELIVFQTACLGLETLFGAFTLWKLAAEPFVSHGLWICGPLLINIVALSGAIGVGAIVRLGSWASQGTSISSAVTGSDVFALSDRPNNKPVSPSAPDVPLVPSVRCQWPGAGLLRTTSVNSTNPNGASLPIEGGYNAQEPGNEGSDEQSLSPAQIAEIKRRFRV